MIFPRSAPANPSLEGAAPAPTNASALAASSVGPAPAIEPVRVAPYAATGVDSSSPEAFIRSVAPYAQRVSQATGIPAEALIGMAANETGYGRFAEGNNLFGIKGTGPAGSFSTQTWEDYGDGRVTIVDNFRGYHSVAESFVDFAKLVTTSPRYESALGQTTVEGFVDALRRGGYMTDPDYVQKISGITRHYAATIHESLAASASGTSAPNMARGAPLPLASPPPVSRAAAGVTVPDQFHIGLPADEAYAACGPVAAVAFAQAYGRNPTPAEAMELAKQSGWTAGGGMNGISNEKRLLDKMQLPARLETSVNWEHIQADALRKQPVILSTPGHYFVVDGYEPSTGAYHVGQSGKVYRGGSEWMTPAEIEQRAGAPTGALFTDHPLVAERPTLPPLQVAAGSRPVLPPLQVAAGSRPVLPPLQVAAGSRPVLPPLQVAAGGSARPVLAADPAVLAAASGPGESRPLPAQPHATPATAAVAGTAPPPAAEVASATAAAALEVTPPPAIPPPSASPAGPRPAVGVSPPPSGVSPPLAAVLSPPPPQPQPAPAAAAPYIQAQQAQPASADPATLVVAVDAPSRRLDPGASILSPGAGAGLAVGAVAASPAPPAPDQQQPRWPARRPEDGDTDDLPRPFAAEDREPRV